MSVELSEKPITMAQVDIDTAEIEAVAEVMRTGHFVQGKNVLAFEQAFADYVGAECAVAVSSGTAALHLAYLACLKPGDEVLVPTFSHIATASMASMMGATPVFCDLDPDTLLLDLADAEKKLTAKTKAIAPVHLFGNVCDITGFTEFAEANNLKVVWDSAQGHGATCDGTPIGGATGMTCYSFYPTKNMTTGEGGMITTDDEALRDRLRLLRSHGQEKKYYHTSLGLNYRMTELGGAIGLQQLEKLPEYTVRRRANAAYLTEGLKALPAMTPQKVSDNVTHCYHQYTLKCDFGALGTTREALVAKLAEQGIGTAIHYPRPLHKQPVMVELYGDKTLPVAEGLSQQVISLPVHPKLEEADLKRILDAIKD